MSYSTADLAEAGRTTRKAVRIWERAGLFGPVERSDQGHRVFTPEQLARARIIAAAQMAGMSIAEIRSANPPAIARAVFDARQFLSRAYNSFETSVFDI